MHFIVQSIEREFEPVPRRRNLGPTPPGNLMVIMPFFDPGIISTNFLLLPGKSLRQSLQRRGYIHYHPARPRHDRTARIRRVDILDHQRQGLGARRHVVPFDRRGYVLLSSLAFFRVLSGQPAFVFDAWGYYPELVAWVRH